MPMDKKKLAAISVAISAYMSEGVRPALKKPRPTRPSVSLWRLSGLQKSMELRQMVQLRFLKKGGW